MLLCEKDCRQDAPEHRKETCPCVPVSYVGNVNGVELITGRDIHWRENQPEVLKKCAARCHPSLNKGPAAMQVLKGRWHSDLTQHGQFLWTTIQQKNVECRNGWENDRIFLR